MLQAYRRAVAAVAGIMASSAVCMQPWSDGGGALLGACIFFMQMLGVLGLCRPWSNDPPQLANS